MKYESEEDDVTLVIPLCDLHAEYEYCRADIDDAIARCISNSSFILGKEVEKFEEAWARRCGVKHCVGVSNATDGLYLALRASGISRAHNVIVPAMTVTADAEAVLRTTAQLFIGDVADRHGMLTLEQIESYHNSHTLHAVILVHLYGQPHPEIKTIHEFTKAHGITLIEDCAHCWGGADVGKRGRFSVWSFFPSKMLGCFGDGGAVTSNESVEHVRSGRNHGRRSSEKHMHEDEGGNYRLDGLQAAILNAKLKLFDRLVEKRLDVVMRYNAAFCYEGKDLPHYVYTMRHQRRDEMREHLKEKGISTGMHYPVSLDKQPIYRMYRYDCPMARRIARETLSIPLGPFLNEKDQGRVIDAVKEFGP